MTEHSERVYEERLLTFIDLCGFGAMIDETVSHTRRVGELYELMSDVTSQNIIATVYGGIPTLGLDGTRELKPAGDLPPEQHAASLKRSQNSWPLDVTHFSDSFVISTPASNVGSTRLHLQLVRALVVGFLRKGITVRGGMTAGRVIHEQGGALFGPAMNRAYRLESEQADWPRVLVDPEAMSVINHGNDDADPLRQLIQPDGQGFWQITPATCCLLDSQHDQSADHRSTLVQLSKAAERDAKLATRFEKLIANWDSTLPPKADQPRQSS